MTTYMEPKGSIALSQADTAQRSAEFRRNSAAPLESKILVRVGDL